MVNGKKNPFVRILIPFILGIMFSFEDSYSWMIAFVVAFFALIIISKTNKNIKNNFIFGIVLSITLFIGGSLLSQISLHDYTKLKDADFYQCVIIEPVKEKKNSFQLTLLINSKSIDNAWSLSKSKALIYMEKDSLSSALKFGNKLLIKGNLNFLEPPKNPKEFDYKRYLENRSIYQQGYLGSDDWRLLDSKSKGLYVFANDARQFLLSSFQSNGIEGDQYAIASALILGSKDELDFEVKQAYATAGAMHVLAVSGLHVGIIFLLLNTLLSILDTSKKGRVFKAIILLIALWSYALLTGLSPSVLRASTMFSFVILGAVLNRKSSIYNTLAASAFFLLIINPNLLFEVGFQLSYVAVLGIVYLQPLIYKRIYTRWWLLDKIWAITAVSIAAQIATLPLTLYYFNQFPVYFMLSNLLVIPSAIVILSLGILLFVTSPFPAVSESVGWVLNKFIETLNFGVKGIEILPNSLIQGLSISIVECAVLYIIIILFIRGLKFRKLKIINYAFFVTLVFIINDLMEDIALANSKSMVVYHINKNQAIDFIDGTSNVLLANSSLIKDHQKQSFHIKSNWSRLDLNNFQYIPSDASKVNETLMDSSLQLFDRYSQFYTVKMVRIDNKFALQPLEEKMNVDYVLIGGNAKTKLKDLYTMFNFKSVIVDGSNSKWNRNRVEAEAENLHIPINNTDKGAFELEI
ncbi:MAG: ComEC/Rec2 family competence protein [Flavobacteriales bacterium]|nr:ComEC/Rec2 family competence protein [Flavobacteriales bacterium]